MNYDITYCTTENCPKADLCRRKDRPEYMVMVIWEQKFHGVRQLTALVVPETL